MGLCILLLRTLLGSLSLFIFVLGIASFSPGPAWAAQCGFLASGDFVCGTQSSGALPPQTPQDNDFPPTTPPSTDVPDPGSDNYQAPGMDDPSSEISQIYN